ncbi:hypothetical protein D7V86_07265 [bacterium D16-51]|nr:hypothetical protein D7V96_10360 [bacterium D16-59]RKI60877.1 hypothetical protein D7V86_07265 [bacterium D16-51]
MITKEQIAEKLMGRYQKMDMGSSLEKGQFKVLFKEAVKDYYPQLKEQYAGQLIYGVSFEIAGVVQKTYSDDFFTAVYFNTEEMYQENIEDCEEDEKSYYRFEAWAEWDVTTAESALFGKLQDYLKQNSLKYCSEISDCREILGKEAALWYEENELDFEEAFEEESEHIRFWMAEALGELRNEGFWEEQGNAGIYVIPFGGECDIDNEELIQTYHKMDLGYHGTEYLDYLESLDGC